MRTARIPSFSMNLAVLPDTLEKNTSRGASVATRCVTTDMSRQSSRELVDLVGTEARPVAVVGDHDGSLQVAEGLHLLEGVRVLREVQDLVFDPLRIQCAVSRRALHASGLCVD